MAKKIVLGKMSDKLPIGKMLIVGVFTQKKKLWETLQELEPEIEKKMIYNDVMNKGTDANYNWVCKLLTTAGRVHILDPETRSPLFFMVECEENKVRDSDFDSEGNPVYNPAVKK
jgi:hypothetical protein